MTDASTTETPAERQRAHPPETTEGWYAFHQIFASDRARSPRARAAAPGPCAGRPPRPPGGPGPAPRRAPPPAPAAARRPSAPAHRLPPPPPAFTPIRIPEAPL